MVDPHFPFRRGHSSVYPMFNSRWGRQTIAKLSHITRLAIWFMVVKPQIMGDNATNSTGPHLVPIFSVNIWSLQPSSTIFNPDLYISQELMPEIAAILSISCSLVIFSRSSPHPMVSHGIPWSGRLLYKLRSFRSFAKRPRGYWGANPPRNQFIML